MVFFQSKGSKVWHVLRFVKVKQVGRPSRHDVFGLKEGEIDLAIGAMGTAKLKRSGRAENFGLNIDAQECDPVQDLSFGSQLDEDGLKLATPLSQGCG